MHKWLSRKKVFYKNVPKNVDNQAVQLHEAALCPLAIRDLNSISKRLFEQTHYAFMIF